MPIFGFYLQSMRLMSVTDVENVLFMEFVRDCFDCVCLYLPITYTLYCSTFAFNEAEWKWAVEKRHIIK